MQRVFSNGLHGAQERRGIGVEVQLHFLEIPREIEASKELETDLARLRKKAWYRQTLSAHPASSLGIWDLQDICSTAPRKTVCD